MLVPTRQFLSRGNHLPKHEAVQINVLKVVLSFQVLPEIILPGPVLGFILTLAHITTIDRLVSRKELVDTSLVSVKVVVRAETLDRLCAAREIAFEGLIMSGLVFPGHSLSAAGHGLTGR
jgi:hypothetical protein